MTAPVPGRPSIAPAMLRKLNGGYALETKPLAPHERAPMYHEGAPLPERVEAIRQRLNGPATHVTIGDDWSRPARLGLLVGASLASWAIVFALCVLGYFIVRSAF